MTDQQIRAALRRIDEDESINVTSWEADFIENVVYQFQGSLSEKQRAAAEKIIERYG